VGLLAREIEACGVTKVGLALVQELAIAVNAPRMLFLHWPFGHALGEPGNVN
jgi:D-proline reductase (dithiol) PrdB